MFQGALDYHKAASLLLKTHFHLGLFFLLAQQTTDKNYAKDLRINYFLRHLFLFDVFALVCKP